MMNIKEQILGNFDLNIEIKESHESLEKISNILKSEFVGIGEQIDMLITSIKPWLFFRDTLGKPLIVNLWGMTGCGKTKLLDRLFELLQLKFLTYRVNSSELNDDNSMSFLNNHPFGNDHPIVIFDDFQNYSAKNEKGELHEKYDSKVWDFIDYGIINYRGGFESSSETGVIPILRILKSLYYLENKTYKKGTFKLSDEEIEKIKRVYKYDETSEDIDNSRIVYINSVPTSVSINETTFLDLNKCFNEDTNKIGYTTYTLRPQSIKAIEDLLKVYGINISEDFEKYILSLSFEEITELMILIGTELYSSRKVPNINLTRALIFIVGNVDAAYDIHNNFNTDISADEFRKISEKVTIVEIKDSLAKSFRSEHIARLGNTHIIFPSLSKRSYQEIIQLYLDEYSIQIKKLYNINLVFEKTIKEILYKENVYPTLGVRPVISGINDMIKSSFASSLLYKDTNKIEADTIEYSYKNKEIEVFYYLNGSLVGGTSHPVTLRLEKLRENKKDDRQALTAVHESGHMIVRILLTNKLPIAVFSVTTDDESDGFTELEVNDEELINVEYIEKYVKLLLGGRCAEIAIFGGGDTLAPGASNDLERANEILLKKHREWGLGGSLLVKDITPKYNGVAREWFQNSVQPFVEEELERLSRETLKLLETHRPLLIAMSKYLMNHASMSQKIMLKLIKENSSIDIDKLLLKDNSKINYGYRDKLLNL